jgi:hypothetical protein
VFVLSISFMSISAKKPTDDSKRSSLESEAKTATSSHTRRTTQPQLDPYDDPLRIPPRVPAYPTPSAFNDPFNLDEPQNMLVCEN